MWSCFTCSRWSCLGSGVGLGDFQRSLPTLQFCDSVMPTCCLAARWDCCGGPSGEGPGDANDSFSHHQEDAVLHQGWLFSIPSCSGSPCQPAHPHGARHPQHSVKQRGSHLLPICFPLLSPEKAHVHRQNAARAVTAGLCFSPTT